MSVICTYKLAAKEYVCVLQHFFPHPTKHFFSLLKHTSSVISICHWKKAYVRWAAKLQDCKFKCQNVNEKCTDIQEACHWNYTELLKKPQTLIQYHYYYNIQCSQQFSLPINFAFASWQILFFSIVRCQSKKNLKDFIFSPHQTRR